MKRPVLIAFAFSTLAGAAPAVAAGESPRMAAPSGVVEHGGGCRKSSPAGQCCHAGSEPYHCH